jgi:hypothetical protein
VTDGVSVARTCWSVVFPMMVVAFKDEETWCEVYVHRLERKSCM